MTGTESRTQPAETMTGDDMSHFAERSRAKRDVRRMATLVVILLLLCLRDVVRLYQGQGMGFRVQLPAALLPYLPGLVLVLILGIVLVAPMLGMGRSPHVVIRPYDVEYGIDDVLGADDLQRSLLSLVREYRNFATLESRYGARPPRAVLFEGPPGTGKTMAAKVLAREAGVPFLFVSASSFQSMYYGQTNRKLRSFFRHLRRLTRRYGGAIGFIEEFDAIGASRAGLGPSGVREGVAGVVAELLVQLQSFDEPRPRVLRWIAKASDKKSLEPRFLLLAATNRASDLDPALVRPGRFDRLVSFGLPSRTAREQMIMGWLSKKSPDSLSGLQSLDLSLVASMTSGMSQAGLNRLLEEAGVLAWKDEAASIQYSHLLSALRTVNLGPSEGVPYDDAQKLRVAIHESGHGCYGWLACQKRRVGVISIHKRGASLGLTASYEEKDTYLHTRSEVVSAIAGMLGGLAAERVFLSEESTGSSSDLDQATRLAFQVVANFGMRGSLISLGEMQPRDISAILATDGPVRSDVELLLAESLEEAERVIRENLESIWVVITTLLDREELYERDLEELLGSPEGHCVAVDLQAPHIPYDRLSTPNLGSAGS